MFLSWNESTSPPHYICYVASFQVSHQLFRKRSLRWVSLTDSCWVSLLGQKNEMLARLWIFTALLKASNMTVFSVTNSCPGLKNFLFFFFCFKTLGWKKTQPNTLENLLIEWVHCSVWKGVFHSYKTNGVWHRLQGSHHFSHYFEQFSY